MDNDLPIEDEETPVEVPEPVEAPSAGTGDMVLWWALGLIVVVCFVTYKQQILDIVWNQPANASTHLFNENPIEYTAKTVAEEGTKGTLDGLLP